MRQEVCLSFNQFFWLQRHVLTAAHCMDEGVTADKVKLYLGTHDKTDPLQVAWVQEILIHPTWDPLASVDSNAYVASGQV